MNQKKFKTALKRFFEISRQKAQTGFTLIELLVVMGIIAILIAVVAVAVNPGKQFAAARDTQRRADISGLLNAIYQYASDNNGKIPTGLDTTPRHIGTNADPTGGVRYVDLSSILVPNYMGAIPMDPSTGTPEDTQYIIFKNGNRVTASASGENTVGYITLTR